MNIDIGTGRAVKLGGVILYRTFEMNHFA